MDALTTESFRERMSADIKKFHTRKEFDQKVWDELVSRFHYIPGAFDDMAVFEQLRAEVAAARRRVRRRRQRPLLLRHARRGSSACICDNLAQGRLQGRARLEAHHRREAVRHRPGVGAASSTREVLANWDENQIYRVDHYLGKETVQNLLAFRFSNGMFEPLWNKNYIDNIQFNVSEAVDVEGRGGYYDSSGVLRDMMQNHMFQMLAYLCMEVPGSFEPDAIRNEKAKLLQSVRVYTPEEVARYVVRGQYGPSRDDEGKVVKPGYRGEKDVNPESKTETYAAARLHIDNWRWEGVPDLSALGQGAVEARHRDHRRVQEGAGGHLPRHAGDEPRPEPAALPHPAVPGHRDPVPGQDPGPADAAPAGATCASPTATRSRRRATPATR